MRLWWWCITFVANRADGPLLTGATGAVNGMTSRPVEPEFIDGTGTAAVDGLDAQNAHQSLFMRLPCPAVLKMPGVSKKIVLSNFSNVGTDDTHPDICLLSRKLASQPQLLRCIASTRFQLS
jgi:hypothetical protein